MILPGSLLVVRGFGLVEVVWVLENFTCTWLASWALLQIRFGNVEEDMKEYVRQPLSKYKTGRTNQLLQAQVTTSTHLVYPLRYSER